MEDDVTVIVDVVQIAAGIKPTVAMDVLKLQILNIQKASDCFFVLKTEQTVVK